MMMHAWHVRTNSIIVEISGWLRMYSLKANVRVRVVGGPCVL